MSLSLVERWWSAIGGAAASLRAHWSRRHVSGKAHAAGRRGTMRAVLAACALATCSCIMFDKAEVDSFISSLRASSFSHSKYDNAFGYIRQKMVDNSEFSSLLPALAYYSTEQFCNLPKESNDYQLYRNIQSHALRADFALLFLNGPADQTRSTDLLSNCKNLISKMENINYFDLNHADIFRLQNLPSVFLKVLREGDHRVIDHLALLKHTSKGQTFLISESVSFTPTPFVTPMLLFELFKTGSSHFTTIFDRASRPIKLMTLALLQLFKPGFENELFEGLPLSSDRNIKDYLENKNASITSTNIYQRLKLLTEECQSSVEPLTVVAQRILELASLDERNICNIFDAEMQDYFMLGSDGQKNAFDISLHLFFSMPKEALSVKARINTMLNLITLPISLSWQSIYTNAGQQGSFSEFLMSELKEWHRLNQNSIDKIISDACSDDRRNALKYLQVFDNIAEYAIAMKSQATKYRSYSSEAHSKLEEEESKSWKVITEQAHCVGRRYEDHFAKNLTEYSVNYPCDCLVLKGMDAFQKAETFVKFAQLKCISDLYPSIYKMHTVGRDTKSLAKSAVDVNFKDAIYSLKSTLENLSLANEQIVLLLNEALGLLHRFLDKAEVQELWPIEAAKQKILLHVYELEQKKPSSSASPVGNDGSVLQSGENRSGALSEPSAVFKLSTAANSVKDKPSARSIFVMIFGVIVTGVCVYIKRKRSAAQALPENRAVAAGNSTNTAQAGGSSQQETNMASMNAAAATAAAEKRVYGSDYSPL